MNLKRTAILGVVGAALVVFIASASTPLRPPAAVVVAPAPTPADLQGAELAAEIARLRNRLRPSAEPRLPARNLFRFNQGTRRAATRVAELPPPAAAEPVAMAAPRPSITLVGIAVGTAGDEATRTAMLAVSGQLIMAHVGDIVSGSYRVASVSDRGVVLAHLESHDTLTLPVK